MHTSHEYSDVLKKLCSGCKLTLWCEYGRSRTKAPSKRAADIDNSDDECAKASKSVKRHKIDEKKKHYKIFSKNLKANIMISIQGPSIGYGLKLLT